MQTGRAAVAIAHSVGRTAEESAAARPAIWAPSASAPRTEQLYARPAWGFLYAIPPVSAGLYILVRWAYRGSAWRSASEYGVAAITLLLFALWIEANWGAALRAEGIAGSPRIRIVYLYLPAGSRHAASPIADLSPRSTQGLLHDSSKPASLPPVEPPRP